MIFTETNLSGAYIIDIEKREDERGFFARSWCQREFVERGLDPNLVQCNLSYNRVKGTLRGMHLQLPPNAETKVIRCTMGALYDVIIDLRYGSPTFQHWTAVDLTAENRRALYVPKGFAHGFLTLADHTEAFYLMSEFHAPESAYGFRWNDPAFSVFWPAAVQVISARDRTYADYDPQKFLAFTWIEPV